MRTVICIPPLTDMCYDDTREHVAIPVVFDSPSLLRVKHDEAKSEPDVHYVMYHLFRGELCSALAQQAFVVKEEKIALRLAVTYQQWQRLLLPYLGCPCPEILANYSGEEWSFLLEFAQTWRLRNLAIDVGLARGQRQARIAAGELLEYPPVQQFQRDLVTVPLPLVPPMASSGQQLALSLRSSKRKLQDDGSPRQAVREDQCSPPDQQLALPPKAKGHDRFENMPNVASYANQTKMTKSAVSPLIESCCL